MTSVETVTTEGDTPESAQVGEADKSGAVAKPLPPEPQTTYFSTETGKEAT